MRLSAAAVSARLRGLGVGRVTGMAVTSRIPASGQRVGTVRITGDRRTVWIAGAQLRRLLGLKSIRFHPTPALTLQNHRRLPRFN